MKNIIISIIAVVMMTTLVGCGSASPTPPKLPTETLDLSELPKKEGKSYVVIGAWKPNPTTSSHARIYKKYLGRFSYEGSVAMDGKKLYFEVESGINKFYVFGSRDSVLEINVEPNKVYFSTIVSSKKENFFLIGDPVQITYVGNLAGKIRIMNQPNVENSKWMKEFNSSSHLADIEVKASTFDKEGEKEFQRVYPAKFAEDL